MLEMDEQLGQATLDRFEMIEPGVGGVELLDQFGDPVLEMAERRLVAARELYAFDLVDQTRDHGFELVGHVLAVAITCFERVGEHCDPAFERGEDAAARRAGRLVHLVAKRTHLFGQLRQRVVRGHMGDDTAHRDDRAFELLEGRGVLGIAADEIDLLGELLHRPVHADEALGRGQGAQRIAHFSESALDSCKRSPIGVGVAGVVEAVGELAHLCFERLDRLARHGLLEHQADLGEIVAQHIDRLVEAAGLPQRLDLGVDLPELLLET